MTLDAPLLGPFRSTAHKSRAEVQEEYCVCRMWKVTTEFPKSRNRNDLLGGQRESRWKAMRYPHGQGNLEGDYLVRQMHLGRA